MINHELYIKRCLEIAKNGLGSTRPNPMVGGVIIHNNKVIGEGYTSSYGGNHAEVNVIKSVTNKRLLKESTLYVTLEPCCHFGKTPPCTDFIIKNRISNVVIGCKDDNIKVAGKGIALLQNNGINVTVGVLNEECRIHHKRFFTFHNKKRPYIILKWAETTNGFIAPTNKKEQKPVWISNTYSRQLTHKWRAEEQAILVGTNTVVQDNPSLTTRDWIGQNPIRVLIDRENKLSKNYNLFNDDAETVVITKKDIDFSINIAKQICDALYLKNINSVIIEGGRKTLRAFINENLWDEARVFIGNTSFKNGIKAPSISGNLIFKERVSTDILKIYKND